ncbi:DUF3060 domain-containing protein [Caulobacter hibisci]|uniref:DUF3060 domain-containing protein n=1 Tax=Caulobacter hibisci TaxID=2035993 RepID=A0ABS0T4A0_9CAUL|nr:DUF3060 domain-containing protein [Caulobacter hibisci]MBI1685920.1 DUF3060 domain-containing protein [Caulobacter hibisci]
MSIVPFLSSLALLAASSQAVGPVATDGKAIAIAGTEHTETLACDGRAATIEGVDNVVTLTGVCRSVAISGSGNTVTVAIAQGGSCRSPARTRRSAGAPPARSAAR